jgi:uncharacterized protein (DUF58 family)
MFLPSKLLLWLTALIIVPAWCAAGMMGVPAESLMVVGMIALGLAALDAITSLDRLRGVSVRLPEEVRTSKGKGFIIEAQVSDAHRQCSALRVGLPLDRQLEVDTPERVVLLSHTELSTPVTWDVLPLERGHYSLSEAFVETSSRLGLWDMRATIPVQCEMHVFPDLSRERHILAPLFMRKGSMGQHQVRQLGKGREFEQLRDYQPGDSYADIYWKGTAKRRYPVTMMHQVERTQEMHVIIDVSRRSARELESGSDDRFAAKTVCERFLQAALVLALASEQQGDRFGMITFSDQVHTTLPVGGGRAHYNACRDALYTLQPRIVTPDYQELFVLVGNRLRHRSLLIILTDLGEPWLSESFVEAVRQAARKHVVLVHSLGSREFQPLFTRDDAIKHEDQLYGRLAGHLLWSDLQATTRNLKQSGVHLTTSLQENLVAEVVSEYLNVKRRQLL